jgi:hypothetical protein
MKLVLPHFGYRWQTRNQKPCEHRPAWSTPLVPVSWGHSSPAQKVHRLPLEVLYVPLCAYVLCHS